MIQDPFQPVIPGTPKSPTTARTFNGLLKAGQDYQRRKFGDLGEGQSADPLVPCLTCYVLNSTGAPLPQGSVLALGPALTANLAVNMSAGQQLPAFATALVADVTLPFVILAGGVPANSMGQAVVQGLAVCTVNVSDATHTRAVPVLGVSAYLASAASGGMPIMSKPDGTGILVCEVLVGDQRNALGFPGISQLVGYPNQTGSAAYWAQAAGAGSGGPFSDPGTGTVFMAFANGFVDRTSLAAAEVRIAFASDSISGSPLNTGRDEFGGVILTCPTNERTAFSICAVFTLVRLGSFGVVIENISGGSPSGGVPPTQILSSVFFFPVS